jgi:hypothetical protein
MPTDKELIERTYGAWLKYHRGSKDTPTLSASTVEEYDGLTYVFLRRGERIIDVFRYLPPTDKAAWSMKWIRRYWPAPYGRQSVAV